MDNSLDLSAAAPCLRAAGFTFAARYLGGPCYQGVSLSGREAAALSQAGLRLVSLYAGANATAAFTCGTQTLSQGQVDGAEAAALAVAVGQPADTVIYLDLEPAQTSPAASWLSYVQGWVTALAAHGYKPGIYSSPDQLTTVYRQGWAGPTLLYWVARPQAGATGAVFPPPCPARELPFASVWQYVVQVTLCGLAGMDIDSASNEVGMWSL